MLVECIKDTSHKKSTSLTEVSERGHATKLEISFVAWPLSKSILSIFVATDSFCLFERSVNLYNIILRHHWNLSAPSSHGSEFCVGNHWRQTEKGWIATAPKTKGSEATSSWANGSNLYRVFSDGRWGKGWKRGLKERTCSCCWEQCVIE